MSKNSAIEIILRVRPNKNTYKGFSIYLVTQQSIKSKTALNFSSLSNRKRDTLITKNKNGHFNSIKFSIWTPNKRRCLIK
jgi:hypothetical protein